MRMVLQNLLVFFIICAVGYFSIPFFYGIPDLARQLEIDGPKQRALLPNYEKLPWSHKHFREYDKLGSEYVSFIGWRRRPFVGETITLEPDSGIRHTPQPNSASSDRSVYFFGGSTMWGTGADDANTIPAHFQRLAGGRVLNFGETAWIAHQSLNDLMRLYTEGHRPRDVVFYDGVNEVITKCRVENTFWSHVREQRIRQAAPAPWPTFWYYAQPALTAAKDVGAFFARFTTRDRPRLFDCDTNSKKADLIAEQLIEDWKVARMIVEAHGGRFHAYLQPVTYFSKTRLGHLSDAMREMDFESQFKALYPLFREKMAKAGLGADLTAVLDRDDFIYVDFCHVSPNGNEIIAERMARDLKPLPVAYGRE